MGEAAASEHSGDESRRPPELSPPNGVAIPEPIARLPDDALSSARMNAGVRTRNATFSLSATGPAVAAAFGGLTSTSVLVWGNPMSNQAHFWLAMLASLVVGGVLSLLLTNARIADFHERMEEYRAHLRELRQDLDRRDLRIRTYEEAVLSGSLKRK